MEKEKLFSWEKNPYLEDFVREFGKPYSVEDDYNPPLFIEDIRSGKNDPIYNVHMYWTKVPPKGIAKLIQHFTSPGDIVLDPFCGSGMTGVASLMTGRHAILIDLSPSATFIAKNYTQDFDPKEFESAVRKIEEEVREEMEWLYETICRHCGSKALINYTLWVDVYRCPICERSSRFWDVAIKDGEVLKEWECPYCGMKLNKVRAKLVGTEPIRVNYNCPRCGRREDEVCEFDLKKLKEIEEKEIPYWYPKDEFPEGIKTREPKRRGIKRVDQFFTKRNLWALARLWKSAEEINLTFLITSLFFEASKQKRGYPPTALRPLRGTLYIPSIMREDNVFHTFSRKQSVFLRGLTYERKGSVIISTQSATDLSPIPDSSIDYCFTDPPYGHNINYSELGFVWEAWLRHFTKIEEEAVINSVQGKGLKEYQDLMERSFKEIFRVLKPGRFLSLTFHNSQTAVWNAIQTALQNAGFEIAYIGVFDKEQRTFNQVTAQGAVGYDVLIHAYKPRISNHIKRERRVEIGEVRAWLEEKLRKLPPTRTEERTARRLYSSFIGWCLSQNISLEDLGKIGLRDFSSFCEILDSFFERIEDYYFLSGQALQEEQPRLFGTITDTQSAISWLRDFLGEPRSYSDIQPAFLQALGAVKLPRSLEDLLEENFIFEEGKWRVARREEEEMVERMRVEKQVGKFENWWRRFEKGEEKDLPCEEIMVNGLREWFNRGKFWDMVRVKETLRRRGVWQDSPYKARTLMEIAEGLIIRGNA